MNKPQNLIAISVRFLGATNTKGARVKLTVSRFNTSKTIPFEYEQDSAEATAVGFFRSHDIAPFARCCTASGSTLLFTFKEAEKIVALFA
jgi:hypothetical protein